MKRRQAGPTFAKLWVVGLIAVATSNLAASGQAKPALPSGFASNASPLDPSPWEHEYFQALRNTVFKTYSFRMPVAFAELPPFDPEWGLVVADRSRDDYFVGVFRADRSVYDIVCRPRPDPPVDETSIAEQLSAVVVTHHRKSLRPELGRRVVELWHRMLAESPTEPFRVRGTDGTLWEFGSSGNDGDIMARAITQGELTRSYLLVHLAHALADFAADQGNEATITEALGQIRDELDPQARHPDSRGND